MGSSSTSACPRCRSTPGSVASPTPTTRRSTCGWTRRRASRPRPWSTSGPRTAWPGVIREFGEERRAGSIAREIVKRRPIETTCAAGHRDQGRDPALRALRPRPSGQAHLPGDPDRGQRRARVARPCAAARLGHPPRRRAPRRDLLPLARGPARQALPRRPRPRLRLPAGAPGLRLRARARGRAAHQARRRPGRRGARAEPARGLGAPARRAQDPRGRRRPADGSRRRDRPRASPRPRPAPSRAAPRRIAAAARPARLREAQQAPAGRLIRPAMAGAALFPQAAMRSAGAVRDFSDSSLIVRLTRGRGWIAVLCALLGGIVALNVLSLSLTAGSGRTLAADRRAEDRRSPRSRPRSTRSSPPARSRRRRLEARPGEPDPKAITFLSATDGDAGRVAHLLATDGFLLAPSLPSSYPAPGTSYAPVPTTSPTTTTTATTPPPRRRRPPCRRAPHRLRVGRVRPRAAGRRAAAPRADRQRARPEAWGSRAEACGGSTAGWGCSSADSS